jgi:nucleoside phosphorylase
MTGIAAGTKKEQNYGDVLIAEAAYDYGSGKITETENGERIFTPSYSQLRTDAGLQALLQRWERDQLQTDVIRRAWYANQPSSPRLIIGLLASGAAVVQSQELVDDILEKSRKVVGLDMEAYGIFPCSTFGHGSTSKSSGCKVRC